MPFDISGVDRAYANFQFETDDSILRNIADIILAAMTVIHREFQKAKSERNIQGMAFWKDKVVALFMFSAQPKVQTRIPASVYHDLLSMERDMK